MQSFYSRNYVNGLPRKKDNKSQFSGVVHYAFDSTTIPLCLSLFHWARFRRHKGGG